MKNIRDLNSEDGEGLDSQEYYNLLELDNLVRGRLENERGDDSSPIYLEIEGGSVVKLDLVSCRLTLLLNYSR